MQSTRSFASFVRKGWTCAIGEKTEAALATRGVVADLIPEDARAEGVIAGLGPALSERSRILLPRAEVAREILPEALREAGAQVDVVPAYRNLPPDEKESERIRSLVDPAEADVVLFTSSSTVTNLCRVLGDEAAARLNALALFSIGPVTTKTAAELGLRVTGTAPEQTIESLVGTVRSYYVEGGDGGA